jgi:hypothetical protein
MSMSTNETQIFAELRAARLRKWAEGAVFALMLAGLLVCAFIITFGLLGAAMDAPAAPYSIGDE